MRKPLPECRECAKSKQVIQRKFARHMDLFRERHLLLELL